MFFSKKTIIQFFIAVIILLIPMIVGAVNITQTVNLKNNGSGTMTYIYMEKETIVKEKNFMIGNLPFTKEKITEYFKAPGTYIQQIRIEKNQNDNSLTQVIVNIGFNDFNKLGEAKAFANEQVKYSGNDFQITIRPDFIKTNSLNQIYFILIPESKILSSNGKVDDKGSSLFVSKEFLTGKSDVNFKATLESDGKTSGSNSSEGSEKSCGLFGLEFPVVFLLGSMLLFSRRNKFKK